MTRQEQLQFCSICTLSKLDLKRGLICTLTNEFAAFEGACPDFVEDPKEKAVQLMKKLEAAGDKESGDSVDYKKNKEYGAIIFFVGMAILLITMAQPTIFGTIIPAGTILFGARKYMKGTEQEKIISQQQQFEEKQHKI